MLHSANDARENVLVENWYTTTIKEMRKIWLISATKYNNHCMYTYIIWLSSFTLFYVSICCQSIGFCSLFVFLNHMNQKIIWRSWYPLNEYVFNNSVANINKKCQQTKIYTICYISDINLILNTRSDCYHKQTKSNFLVSMQIILTSQSSITNVWMSFSPLSNFTNVGWFLCWYNVSTKTAQVADIYVWTLSVHI